MSFVDHAPLFTRRQVLAKPALVPAVRGVYGWYFRAPPPAIPIDDCHKRDDWSLLYVGISPKNARSRQNLRKRIVYHLRGNAEGSTLRLTLGALLYPSSDFPLRRVGGGNRMTFTHLGEQWLDEWLNENAMVCWTEHDEPWLLENEILERYSLPLNIQDNRHHPWCSTLSAIRQEAKSSARELPVANEGNQQRRMVGEAVAHPSG